MRLQTGPLLPDNDAAGPKVNGVSRVLRGGAFNNSSRNLRCSNRNRNASENRNRNIGFRCVLAPRRQHASKGPVFAYWRHAGSGRGLAPEIHGRPVPVVR
jgi:hypothetical protein